MTKKLAVIFLENPPYLTTASDTEEKNKRKLVVDKERSYIWNQMKSFNINMLNLDLDEQFTWSVFNVYDTYAYIHYGPLKTVKYRTLTNKEIRAAYMCNRRYFNASDAVIALIYWTSKNKNNDVITFDSELGKCKIKKVYNNIDKILLKFASETGICKIRSKSYNNNYLNTVLSDDNKNEAYFRWISKDNLLYALPIFVSGRDEYIMTGKNPYNNTVDFRVLDSIIRCGDGDLKYTKDTEFLQDCLLWVLCSNSYVCNPNGEFYTTCESLLDDDHKNTEIYKLYKQLVDETGINGLKNIQHTLGRTNTDVNKLKYILSIFQYETIRPKMLEYELLK